MYFFIYFLVEVALLFGTAPALQATDSRNALSSPSLLSDVVGIRRSSLDKYPDDRDALAVQQLKDKANVEKGQLIGSIVGSIFGGVLGFFAGGPLGAIKGAIKGHRLGRFVGGQIGEVSGLEMAELITPDELPYPYKFLGKAREAGNNNILSLLASMTYDLMEKTTIPEPPNLINTIGVRKFYGVQDK